jgi:glycogen phosphorylase
LEGVFAAHLARPSAGAVAPERPIAFLCAEYGVHESLPVYADGLGGLAGDLLKEASDRALPLVAVGLMYRQGYFRQRLDVLGWQQEY